MQNLKTKFDRNYSGEKNVKIFEETWKILEKFVENLKIFYEIVKYYEEFLRKFLKMQEKNFEEILKILEIL